VTTAAARRRTGRVGPLPEGRLHRCVASSIVVASPSRLLRDNLAGAHTTQTAMNKAATAVSFRTDTTRLPWSRSRANRRAACASCRMWSPLPAAS